jgi:hypothetical protein
MKFLGTVLGLIILWSIGAVIYGAHETSNYIPNTAQEKAEQAAYDKKETEDKQNAVDAYLSSRVNAKPHHAFVTRDLDILPLCRWGGDRRALNCDDQIGSLKQGDTVLILSPIVRSIVGVDVVKVRFGQWTGYTVASGLSDHRYTSADVVPEGLIGNCALPHCGRD